MRFSAREVSAELSTTTVWQHDSYEVLNKNSEKIKQSCAIFTSRKYLNVLDRTNICTFCDLLILCYQWLSKCTAALLYAGIRFCDIQHFINFSNLITWPFIIRDKTKLSNAVQQGAATCLSDRSLVTLSHSLAKTCLMGRELPTYGLLRNMPSPTYKTHKIDLIFE